MIIQILLTSFFCIIAVYAFILISHSPFLGWLQILLAVGATVLVWFPESTTMAANAVGVGRGADLLLYLWFIISGLLIFASHLKIRRLGVELTELARYVAIRDAERTGYEAEARVDAAGARKIART